MHRDIHTKIYILLIRKHIYIFAKRLLEEYLQCVTRSLVVLNSGVWWIVSHS